MSIQNMKREQKGSALILVIIVTVLLSVVGIMFVMTMRMREMTTANVTDDRDLDTAVEAVTEKIDTVLLQDLFGTTLAADMVDSSGGNERYDSLGATDTWLASLEPVPFVNISGLTDYYWPQVTDLFNDNFGIPTGGTYYDPQVDTTTQQWDGSMSDYKVDATRLLTKIIPEGERVYVIKQNAPDWSEVNLWQAGARADADGDGVADSRWVMIPGLSTSKSKAVYAAVRIIDNCAMLNLNTAYCFYQKPFDSSNPTSPFVLGDRKFWYINQAAYAGGSAYCGTAFSSTAPYGDGGRYLSEINYLPFLRGRDLNGVWGSNGDGWYNILANKKFASVDGGGNLTAQLSTEQAHQVLMNIENPGSTYSLFDIGDELEIRNRYLLTSLAESRFERSDVGNFTFDAGGNDYIALTIPRDKSGNYPLLDWRVRIDSRNFDFWDEYGVLRPTPPPFFDYRFKYDRRHLCTFYSFDRNLRYGKFSPTFEAAIQSVPAAQREAVESVFRPRHHYPIDLRTIDITSNSIAARRNILHLLYAFREGNNSSLLVSGYKDEPAKAWAKATMMAAQQVANMIDFMDDDTTAATGPFGDPAFGSQKNSDPTYINKTIVDAMLDEVSGSDSAVTGNPNFDLGLGAAVVYGYERQPFISEVYCNYDPSGGAQGFALELLNPYTDAIDLNGWNIRIGTANYPFAPASTYVVPGGSSIAPGRLVIYAGTIVPSVPSGSQVLGGFGLGTLLNGNVLKLQRPKPDAPGSFLTVDGTDSAQTTFLMSGSVPVVNVSSRDDLAWKFTNRSAYIENHTQTLGLPNSVTATGKGYYLPVDNVPLRLDRFADFQKIAWVEPNDLTAHIDLDSVRFDMNANSALLGYVSTLTRQEKGIPGRININTAPLYVIAAAIPPQLVITVCNPSDPNSCINPLTLAQKIIGSRPYTSMGDVLKLIPEMKKYAGDPNTDVGEQGIRHDSEESDWIINRLSNIFTVRSDTFTAYILVRLGSDGPQRRMIAIFDRSNCWSATDKPRLVALHPVPDPR